MARYVAFLRAINVGGRNVKMERLRELFVELDLTNIETFIASGNVIFDSTARNLARLEQRIASHLEQSLKYEVTTFIRSVAEVDAIARHQPFTGDDQDLFIAHTVLLLPVVPPAAVCKAIATLRTEFDHFQLQGRDLHWLTRRRLGESADSAALLAKTLHPLANTARNVTTIRKLALKYA